MKFWMNSPGTMLALMFLALCKLTRAGCEAGDNVVRRSTVMVRVEGESVER